jgi:hypothetical protein
MTFIAIAMPEWAMPEWAMAEWAMVNLRGTGSSFHRYFINHPIFVAYRSILGLE